MPPTVAIVGRPNVGKSTLFNRLAGRRLAIVDDRPGVTRDRREAPARLGDLHFTLIDTAGYEDARGEELAARVQAQTERALHQADVVLFLVDARAGVTPLDRQLADLLRRSARPFVLIANKSEGRAGEAAAMEAFVLGLGSPLPLSAEHGEGLNLLYESLMTHFDRLAEGATAAPSGVPGEVSAGPAAPLKLAIVGRPNVGKSTLINRLIGDERLVTGPEAGITRDAIAIAWSYGDRPIEVIDTAGLRRRARVDDKIESLAGADALRAIRFAHVVATVVDAVQGLDKQDLSIMAMVGEEGRAPLLLLNKWDAVADRDDAWRRLTARAEGALPQLRGLRAIALSALTGAGVKQILPAACAAYDIWNQRITTARLNRWLIEAQSQHPPPRIGGRPLKFRYATQAKARPPSFVLFANRPEVVPEDYRRYLVNSLRDTFTLPGVPIRLTVRGSHNPYAEGR